MFSEIKIKSEWGNCAWHFKYKDENYAHVITTDSEIIIVEDMLKTMKDLVERDKS